MQKEEVSTKKTKAKDVRIDSAKKINTKSKIKNAEEISKKKANVKPKVEKIEQQLKERKFHKYLWYLIIFSTVRASDTPAILILRDICIRIRSHLSETACIT